MLKPGLSLFFCAPRCSLLKSNLRPLLEPYLESEDGSDEIGEEEWDRMMRWENRNGTLTISGLYFKDNVRKPTLFLVACTVLINSLCISGAVRGDGSADSAAQVRAENICDQDRWRRPAISMDFEGHWYYVGRRAD